MRIFRLRRTVFFFTYFKKCSKIVSMKFIHCADLHLDSKIDSLPSDKGKIRREEVIRTFERLADYATKNGVTAVIIAGDMFDSSKCSAKTKARVLSAIKNNPDVDFLYLTGNHDEEDALSGEDLPDNLKKFGESATKFVYENVVITGVSSCGKNLDMFYGSLDLDEKNFNIVVLHGQVAGYKSHDNAEIISLPLLREKNVDYLALGHIHSYVCDKLDERGVFAYSGCLDGRGFDETDEKGFILIDTGKENPSYDFISFCSRTFYEEEFSVDGQENWYDFCTFIIENLKSRRSADSLIKVVLTGRRKINFDADVYALTLRLNEEFFFAKVYDKTSLELTAEDFENDKSVRGEFVRLVLKSDLPKEKKDAVITLGLNALKGEDVR